MAVSVGKILAGLLLAVGVVVFAVAVVPIVQDRVRDKTYTITGRMALFDYEGSERVCFGEGGYSDMKTGTAVTVKNEKGTLIGTGALETGRLEGERGSRVCVFPFTVTEVKDAAFYEVEVARRGGLTYSKAELAAKDWKVEASLGS